MLELGFIRENKEALKKGLITRNFKAEALEVVDTIIALDDNRKNLQTELDSQKAEANQLSKSIGELFKTGRQAEAKEMKDKVANLKGSIKEGEEKLASILSDLENHLLTVPNIPHPSVPPGKSDEDNEVHVDWPGQLPDLGEEALPHWELATKYNLFDLQLGAKIVGAGFPLYRGKGAKLQRALINFFLDEAHEAGYEEIIPPLLVNADSAKATGQLPDKDGQMYHVTEDNFYLIPTAEVPITNMYRDIIVDETDLPIKLSGYTPCFRREAGSYGAHVRGLNRVHQFDKIEIVRIEHPDNSYNAQEEMIQHISSLLDKLELPYRILRLCGGDLTFTSTLTFDFEIYSAAQKRWLEVSSVSNFETYQSNRLKLRVKDANNKKQLAHTLNGSALALARIVAGLLENNQTPDGIVIPQALRLYTGFDIIE